MLAMIRHPAAVTPEALTLVIAHGLYGSGRNWGVIARRLADRREVVAVDMRNHGDSPRAAMQLALTRPELIRRLIVSDIAPVAYDHDQSRHARAMAALDLSRITTRAEADTALATHVDDAALRAFFLQSLDLKSKPPRWRLNLAVLEAEMPKIVGWPDTQGQFDHPTLFLTGGLSSYVRPEHRDVIRALFPKARFAKLHEAGHWLHAEKPREFEETVRVFLEA
jgi:esterase